MIKMRMNMEENLLAKIPTEIGQLAALASLDLNRYGSTSMLFDVML